LKRHAPQAFRFLIFMSTMLCLSSAFAQDSTTVRPAQVAETASINQDSTRLAAQPFWHSTLNETKELIAEDIQDFTLTLPGIQALDMGSIGQLSPLIAHGALPQESGLLLNGLPFLDPILSYTNPMAIPINLVSSSSFLGPGSFAPFGFQSIGGTLDVQTFPIEPNHPYSKVFYRVGDWGYSDLGVLFVIPLSRKMQVTISGNRQEFDGFLATGQDHTGTRMQAELLYHPKNDVTFGYTFYRSRDKNEIPAPMAPAFIPLPANARREEFRFEHRFKVQSGDLLRTKKRFQANVVISNLRETSFSGTTALFKNRNLMFSGAVQQDFLLKRHHLAFGGTAQNHKLTGKELGDHSDIFSYGFVRDELLLGQKWRLGFQARVEKHDAYAAAFTPAAHLVYKTGDFTQFYAGGQRAKRYPGFAERFWPGQTFHGNPDLKEETSHSTEVGFKKTKGNNLLQISVFQNRMSDWITTAQVDSTSGPVNSGVRNIRGADAKLIWKYAAGGQAGFVGSYLHVNENALNKQLLVPEWSFYSFLEYGHSFFDKYVFIKVRLDGRFFGKRTGLSYVNDPNFGDYVQLNSDFVVDGKISLIFKDAKIVIAQENMFDRVYQLTPGFLMPIRNIRFGVEWEFWD